MSDIYSLRIIDGPEEYRFVSNAYGFKSHRAVAKHLARVAFRTIGLTARITNARTGEIREIKI